MFVLEHFFETQFLNHGQIKGKSMNPNPKMSPESQTEAKEVVF